eukprot:6910407-Pyramimonas_sp.AAC.1
MGGDHRPAHIIAVSRSIMNRSTTITHGPLAARMDAPARQAGPEGRGAAREGLRVVDRGAILKDVARSLSDNLWNRITLARWRVKKRAGI